LFDFTAYVVPYVERDGQRRFNIWPLLLLFCSTIGFLCYGLNLGIELVQRFWHAKSASENLFTLTLQEQQMLIWTVIGAVGRLAALNLGSNNVKGTERGPADQRITAQRLFVVFRRLLLLAALAGGGALAGKLLVAATEATNDPGKIVRMAWMAGISLAVLLFLKVVWSFIRLFRGVRQKVNETLAAGKTAPANPAKNNSARALLPLVPILVAAVVLILVSRNIASKRAAEAQQQARGALQSELGDKLGKLFFNDRRITYASVKFDYVPDAPRILLHYDGLKDWRSKTNGVPRALHGDLVLNFEPPDFWRVTGAGDLAEINTSFQTAAHGYVWWANAPANTDAVESAKTNPAVSPALLAEPPKLQFLAWQDEWQTNQPGAARHPDGSPVTAAMEMSWLKNVNAGGMEGTFESHPRFLKLWFSHPAFKRTDFAEVSLLDDNGRSLKLGADGSSSCSLVDANEGTGWLGWRCWSGSPVGGTNYLSHLTVQLRFAVGPLERTQEVRPDFNGTMSLEGKSILNAIGQNARGRAFVSIAVNAKAMQSRAFDVMAVAKDGREILRFGSGRGGAVGAGVGSEKFDFQIPLSDVSKFIIGTRPIRTNEWKDVVLPGAIYKLVQNSKPNVAAASATESANQKIARLKLQQAEQEVKTAEAKFSVGVMTEYELQKVKWSRDIAAAEVRSDNVEIARLKLAIAELDLAVVGKKVSMGKATPEEYDQAKLARDTELIHYKLILHTNSTNQP